MRVSFWYTPFQPSRLLSVTISPIITSHLIDTEALESVCVPVTLRSSDVWKNNNNSAIYTHYTPHGAARLDRLCVSPSLRNRKMGVEKVRTLFYAYI